MVQRVGVQLEVFQAHRHVAVGHFAHGHHRDAAARGQQAQQDSGDREADASPPGMMDAAQGQTRKQDCYKAGKDAAHDEQPG